MPAGHRSGRTSRSSGGIGYEIRFSFGESSNDRPRRGVKCVTVAEGRQRISASSSPSKLWSHHEASFKLLPSLILMAAVAHANGQPEQKLGLWQRTSQTTEDGKTKSPEKSQHCVDAATLEMVKHALADAAKMCSRYDLRQVGGRWLLDSVCNFGTTKLTLHQETLMNGETAYHSESESTYSPPLSGGGHSCTITDGVSLCGGSPVTLCVATRTLSTRADGLRAPGPARSDPRFSA